MYKKSFDYLKLGEVNPTLSEFVEHNFNYFMNNNFGKTKLDAQGGEGFILYKNCSYFKLIFEPSHVTPESIFIELGSFYGNYTQSFKIDFKRGKDNYLVITGKKRLLNTNLEDKDDVTLLKIMTETFYMNNKKRYEHTQQTFSGKKNCDDGYSQSVSVCYSDVDDSYIQSSIVIAEPEALLNTAVSYTKFDGSKTCSVQPHVFASEFDKIVQEKAKIKSMQKD